MSMTQTIIGIGVLAVVASAALQSVLPGAPPFTVHSLRYEAGTVYQDRAIVTDGVALYAEWAAAVIEVSTGNPVPWCIGSGAFPYQPGRFEKASPLEDWTGRSLCTGDSLLPGQYILRGTWQWGSGQTSHDSAIFTVEQ